MYRWIFLLCVLSAQALVADQKVLLFSGSTRKDSYNKKLIMEAARALAKLGAKHQVIDLNDFPMPFYDGDLEAASGMPEKAKVLRKLMIEHEVIVIASPEYNRSISAVLKNAIDWASRGENGGSSRTAFKDKTFVLLSAGPGSYGGKRSLIHLRTIIEAIGGKCLLDEFSVPNAHNAFDQKGTLTDPQLQEGLQELLFKALSTSK